ncbi:hypothetical protein QBC34DRAFT_275732, partial [Podospora aff. communis PSN243]
PPATPYPRLWRCHQCRSIYRLGCTRRCLECSHIFCTGPVPDKKKGKKQKGPCRAEFDYGGWAAWGSYRRSRPSVGDIDVDKFATYTYEYESTYGTSEKGWVRLPSEEVDEVNRRKEGMYMRREHDCWKHCDFPSECRHAMYAACVE